MPVNLRIQNMRIRNRLSGNPKGDLGRLRHILEILRRHINVFPADPQPMKSGCTAVRPAGNQRAGLIIPFMIPFFGWNGANTAAHGKRGFPNLRWGPTQRVDHTHAGNGYAFRLRMNGHLRRKSAGSGLFFTCQLGMQFRKCSGFVQDPGADSAHELALSKRFVRIHPPARSGIDPSRCRAQTPCRQLFHLKSQLFPVNAAGCGRALQFQYGSCFRIAERPYPEPHRFSSDHSRSLGRFEDLTLVEFTENAGFHDLTGSQVGGSHLDGIGAQHRRHAGGFSVADPSGQNQSPSGEQIRSAIFQINGQLRQRQRAVTTDMAAGFATLADDVTVSRFQCQLHQIFGRRDVNGVDSCRQQQFPLRRLPGGDHGKTGPMFQYPGQLLLSAGILRQHDNIDRIRFFIQDLRYPAEFPLQKLRTHHAHGQGRQCSRLGHFRRKFRRIGNPGHGALKEGQTGTPCLRCRTVRKTSGDFLLPGA